MHKNKHAKKDKVIYEFKSQISFSFFYRVDDEEEVRAQRWTEEKSLRELRVWLLL